MNTVHFSSQQVEWETPPQFFDYCNYKYGPFTLDAAANIENHKCDDYFDVGDNALTRDWYGIVWLNPPYGRGIGDFVAKAWHEVDVGHVDRVVCLLPARTDTRWFHRYCTQGVNVFIEGRLRFVGADSSAPFPSMLTMFDYGIDEHAINTLCCGTLSWRGQ
jgi:phage N-6-adenine-methyltransferase